MASKLLQPLWLIISSACPLLTEEASLPNFFHAPQTPWHAVPQTQRCTPADASQPHRAAWKDYIACLADEAVLSQHFVRMFGFPAKGWHCSAQDSLHPLRSFLNPPEFEQVTTPVQALTVRAEFCSHWKKSHCCDAVCFWQNYAASYRPSIRG